MKEVLETVSEVQFRTIAVIVAVAVLCMLGTWWVLTDSASPPLSSEETRYEARLSPEGEQNPSDFSVQPEAPSENLQIIVEKGPPAVPVPQTFSDSVGMQEPEATGVGFIVQIGAFRQEEGAKRRLKELEERGCEARLVSDDKGGAVVFRVVAGNFSTREEAAVAVKDLKSSGIDAFVRKAGTEQ